jgi:hypothetical protein
VTALQERSDVEAAEDTRERVVVWDTGEVLYVHPVASLFPMMSEEELDDLAEDIQLNGLADPIVLDQHRQLIDGRNRLEACRRAGVSPDFTVVTLDDPIALILSKNVARRHLTRGQQAMAVARAAKYQIDTLPRGTAARLSSELGINKMRVSQAFTILEYAPEYGDGVLFRGVPLTEALAKAQERKAAAQSDEAKLERLKVDAPDLADLVTDERLTLAGALAEVEERRRKVQERERKAQEYRALTTQQLDSALAFLDPRQIDAALLGQQLAANAAPDALPHRLDLSPARIRACAAVLESLAQALSMKEP